MFFLYRAETLVTPEQKLYAERTVLLFSMVAAILASVAVSFLATNHALAQAAVVAALVWLIGASWFLYRSMRSLEAARTAREKHRIGESEVRYVDSEGEKPKLFVSSLNWNRNAATNNREVGLIVEGREIAEPFRAAFERDWGEAAPPTNGADLITNPLLLPLVTLLAVNVALLWAVLRRRRQGRKGLSEDEPLE